MAKDFIQIMDVTSIKAVLSELRKKIVPSRFEKAIQPDSTTIQLGFRTLEGLTWVEISWHANYPRIVEIEPPEKDSGQSTLAKQIQNVIKEGALIELKQEGFERIIEFSFAARPKEFVQTSLIVELMGKHSNILLLDQKKTVITMGKQVREKQSRLRPISTGDTYKEPPPLPGNVPDLSLIHI